MYVRGLKESKQKSWRGTSTLSHHKECVFCPIPFNTHSLSPFQGQAVCWRDLRVSQGGSGPEQASARGSHSLLGDTGSALETG